MIHTYTLLQPNSCFPYRQDLILVYLLPREEFLSMLFPFDWLLLLDFDLDDPIDDLLPADELDDLPGLIFLMLPDLPALDLGDGFSFRDFPDSFIFPDDFVELFVFFAERFLSDWYVDDDLPLLLLCFL